MESMLVKVGEQAEISSNKVSIVGVGQVGMACAYSILNKGISSDVALVDSIESKVQGELMDLQHGSAFLHSASLHGSTDFGITKDSKVVIITAGVRQKGDETRFDLLKKNVDVFKQIVPEIAKHSPNAILLVVSNPVDILTYLAWKLSGFPKNRVIGSGTNLDSSRFRFLISEKLNLAPEDCHAWIIGEHGDSSVPVWSGVNVVGMSLRQFNPKMGLEGDEENWKDVHLGVINGGYTVRNLKGYTSWAIALSVANITESIIRNDSLIHAVSTLATNFHDIDKEVFLSLPCTIGASGVTHVVVQTLTKEERNALQKSADILHEHTLEIKL